MIVKEIALELDYEKAGLNTPSVTPKFVGFIPQNYNEYCGTRRRPAVVVLPGGGYGYTSEREATPIATEFLTCGAATFVLYYSVAPDRFPTSLCQVYAAIRQIRKNADEWNIDPNNIAVIGFSAGGHLASTVATHPSGAWKPGFQILFYPVITMGTGTHARSRQELLGENPSQALIEEYSNELQVTKNTPKCFLTYASNDTSVSPKYNGEAYYNALVEHGVEVQREVYNEGGHGWTTSFKYAEDIRNKLLEWICNL